MSVRPFDWRDLPALYRCREHSLFLDSALVLTAGPMLVQGALLSYLAPGTGIITAAANGKNGQQPKLIGQAMQTAGSQVARLTFLTPAEALGSSSLYSLLDYLVAVMGEHGAFRLLAEVEESASAFDYLRQASFSIYSRQRIWGIEAHSVNPRSSLPWRPADSIDAPAIRALYNNLVPGLVQQVEPFAFHKPHGMVYYQGDELQAFVELRYGLKGIWAQPFVHPDAASVKERMADLLLQPPNQRSRPIYTCIRSYQSWLEAPLEEIGARPGPRQAVMAKHIAIAQKAERPFALPALEASHPEVSAPIAHFQQRSD